MQRYYIFQRTYWSVFFSVLLVVTAAHTMPCKKGQCLAMLSMTLLHENWVKSLIPWKVVYSPSFERFSCNTSDLTFLFAIVINDFCAFCKHNNFCNTYKANNRLFLHYIECCATIKNMLYNYNIKGIVG